MDTTEHQLTPDHDTMLKHHGATHGYDAPAFDMILKGKGEGQVIIANGQGSYGCAYWVVWEKKTPHWWSQNQSPTKGHSGLGSLHFWSAQTAGLLYVVCENMNLLFGVTLQH